MTEEEAINRLHVKLNSKTDLLLNEIKRFLIELPFDVIDEGFSKKDINGIHFEYEVTSFEPIACPLNIKTGYCGAGEVVEILDKTENQVFNFQDYEDLITLFPEEEKEEFEENLLWFQADVFEKWFANCWKEVRHLRPDIKGFVSIHDAWYRVDLDTGLKFEEGKGDIKFF